MILSKQIVNPSSMTENQIFKNKANVIRTRKNSYRGFDNWCRLSGSSSTKFPCVLCVHEEDICYSMYSNNDHQRFCFFC